MTMGVETVWIDNPPLNTISEAVAGALARDFGSIDSDVRVAVLRGRGERAFSAGADLRAMRADGTPPLGIQPLADLIETLPVPVVAAIQGHCLGGGLELALACDLRIADRSARLALPEVRLGIIPGGGGTQRLPRLIGPGRAAWLMMSGEALTAAEAEAWGLVEFAVDDLGDGVDRVAGAIAAQSPTSVRELKRLLRATREGRDDRLELEAFTRCLGSGDGGEGIAAFLEKRPPVWRPVR
jgi:enoyl-CoA hydratase/carnithine racemase